MKILLQKDKLVLLLLLLTFLFIVTSCEKKDIPIDATAWKVEYDFMVSDANNELYHAFPYGADPAKTLLLDSKIVLVLKVATEENKKHEINPEEFTTMDQLMGWYNDNCEPWKPDGTHIVLVGGEDGEIKRKASEFDSYLAGIKYYDGAGKEAIGMLKGAGSQRKSIGFIFVQKIRDDTRLDDTNLHEEDEMLEGALFHELGHLRGIIEHLCEEPNNHDDNYCIMSENLPKSTCSPKYDVLSVQLRYCKLCMGRLIDNWVIADQDEIL